VDKDGTVVPDAGMMLHFSASGGSIVATDNGDNAFEAPFESPDRLPLRGSAIAIVRGTGDVRVSVKADGLAGDQVLLKGAK
jgi:beta-galactosidase